MIVSDSNPPSVRIHSRRVPSFEAGRFIDMLRSDIVILNVEPQPVRIREIECPMDQQLQRKCSVAAILGLYYNPLDTQCEIRICIYTIVQEI